MVSGTDVDGDTWTLRLIGPGSMNVVKQNGPDGTPAPLNSQTEINSITVAGTNPLSTRLIGTVKKGPNGDGKVFFNTFDELKNQSLRLNSIGLGLLSIKMPGFWLGNTTPTSSTATPVLPTIEIPDGVSTLDFGGVDTTHNRVNPPPTGATSDIDRVHLGLPAYGGTRIIIDKSISSTQSMPSTTAGGSPTIIQHGVEFAVAGRLQLFQANEIDGDPLHPPGQFSDQVSTATGDGGTKVVSTTDTTPPFFTVGEFLSGAVTGAMGTVRVGGNATNFITLVHDDSGTSGARLNNFSIGGETNNVLVVAPNGMQNAAFGKGMDTTDILSNVLNTLQANRGAINSNVYINRTISQVRFGGDVDNTNILTGVSQNFTNVFEAVAGVSASGAITSPTAPPVPTGAQIGGGMTALVGGNINDSVFSASVQPFNSTFGDPNQIVLPSGQIAAKVTGVINNLNATPSAPTTAFFANQVHLNHGPIIPPNVPEPPYSKKLPVHAPGLHNGPLMIGKLKGLPVNPVRKNIFTGGVAIPRGPLAHIVQ
jgi:hypothetical protein